MKRHGILLEPTNLNFENKGVFNPACIRKGKHVYMFYRAWNKLNRSTIGYCKLEGPLKVIERKKEPFLFSEPEHNYNLEDPRITFLNGTYYLIYTAYDGDNVRIAYAASKNLKHFKKHGIISPELTYNELEKIFLTYEANLKEKYILFKSYFVEKAGKKMLLFDKDALLFPKKIKGKFALIHRLLPSIQIVYFKSFKNLTVNFWKNYFKKINEFIVLEQKYWYESNKIGGGCPPIETNKGWLLIYHGVDKTKTGEVYRASAALLDKKDPTKVIARLREPLFSPKENWEKRGNVNNVVFPNGAVVFGERLYIYYGAADERIGVISCNLNSLLTELIEKNSL